MIELADAPATYVRVHDVGALRAACDPYGVPTGRQRAIYDAAKLWMCTGLCVDLQGRWWMQAEALAKLRRELGHLTSGGRHEAEMRHTSDLRYRKAFEPTDLSEQLKLSV